MLPELGFSRIFKGMEVQFSPEQQAHLRDRHAKLGPTRERLVAKVIARYIDKEARFLAAVENGIAAAERGEFIEEEEEEMDARLEGTEAVEILHIHHGPQDWRSRVKAGETHN